MAEEKIESLTTTDFVLGDRVIISGDGSARAMQKE